MGGEVLDAADLHRTWMHGDRQYAFVKASDTSDFPWLTARDVPDLVRHRARYVGDGGPKRARLLVRDPDGAEHDIRATLPAGTTSGTPQVLLAHHLKQLKLPTVLGRKAQARKSAR